MKHFEKVSSNNEKISKKTYYEARGKKFEVCKPPTLNFSDVELGDRAFIKTKSGNRYMIRHSKRLGGALMIYNEKADGFQVGYPIHLVKGNLIAEVGKDFDFTIITDQKNMTGRKIHATEVVEIEIRRGLDKFVEKDMAAKKKDEDFESIMKKFTRAVKNGTVDDI